MTKILIFDAYPGHFIDWIIVALSKAQRKMKQVSSFRTIPLVVGVVVVVVSAAVVLVVVVVATVVVVVVATVVVVLTVVLVVAVVVFTVVVVVVAATVVVVAATVVVVATTVVDSPAGREPVFFAVPRPSESRASKPSSVASLISSSVAFATSSGDVSFGVVASASYSAFARVSALFPACRRRRPVDKAATDVKPVT